jgi:hypothetical protein
MISLSFFFSKLSDKHSEAPIEGYFDEQQGILAMN